MSLKQLLYHHAVHCAGHCAGHGWSLCWSLVAVRFTLPNCGSYIVPTCTDHVTRIQMTLHTGASRCTRSPLPPRVFHLLHSLETRFGPSMMLPHLDALLREMLFNAPSEEVRSAAFSAVNEISVAECQRSHSSFLHYFLAVNTCNGKQQPTSG